jgi:hypothetical protein
VEVDTPFIVVRDMVNAVMAGLNNNVFFFLLSLVEFGLFFLLCLQQKGKSGTITMSLIEFVKLPR